VVVEQPMLLSDSQLAYWVSVAAIIATLWVTQITKVPTGEVMVIPASRMSQSDLTSPTMLAHSAAQLLWVTL